jgi:predicted sulfurtransferase
MKKKSVLVVFVIIFFVVGAFATLVRSADAPRMTTDELKAMLGSPDLVIIDVRYGKDWADSDLKITGAVREDPRAIESWANKYPKDKTIVLYCA